MRLLKDFGPDSRLAEFRYDAAPASRDERRTCTIAIEPDATAATLRYRIGGYAGAVSDLLGGRHVRLFRSDDPQTEFGRYVLRVDLEKGEIELAFADLDDA